MIRAVLCSLAVMLWVARTAAADATFFRGVNLNGPALVIDGLLIAIAIGFIGGLLPAIRAARLPVTTALRAG